MLHRIIATTLIGTAAVGCANQDNGGRTPFGTLPRQQHIWYQSEGTDSREESGARADDELEVVQQEEQAGSMDPARVKEINEEQAQQQAVKSDEGDEVGVGRIEFDSEEQSVASTDESATAEEASMDGLALDEPDYPEERDSTFEACRKALGVMSDNTYDVFEFGAKKIKKTVLNVDSDFAVITFAAEKRIINASVQLRNPKGKYCIDMTAGKVIRKVKVSAVCGARVMAISTKANRTKNVTIDLCQDQ